MQNLKKSLTPLLLLIFCFMEAEAQYAIPASGGAATGTGGNVSYTIGQLWYTTIENNDATVFQGVQQPFEILEITGLPTMPGISLNASLFPNPADQYILIRLDDLPLNDLAYQLTDLQGKMLETGSITRNETTIPMSRLGASTYLVRITQNNALINVYKIIKK